MFILHLCFWFTLANMNSSITNFSQFVIEEFILAIVLIVYYEFNDYSNGQ